MTKFNTLIKFKDNTVMYLRDSKLAFESAKSNGLTQPENYMYMYSLKEKDFFKDTLTRKYISFNQ